MPSADPYSSVKREILRMLTEAMKQHDFSQFRSTCCFIRDRGSLRDVFFFQKVRSNAIAICYGTGPLLNDVDWEPSVAHGRWLNEQEFYRCKYVAQVEQSIGRAIEDFEVEAIPWFIQFQSVADLPPPANL